MRNSRHVGKAEALNAGAVSPSENPATRLWLVIFFSFSGLAAWTWPSWVTLIFYPFGSGYTIPSNDTGLAARCREMLTTAAGASRYVGNPISASIPFSVTVPVLVNGATDCVTCDGVQTSSGVSPNGYLMSTPYVYFSSGTASSGYIHYAEYINYYNTAHTCNSPAGWYLVKEIYDNTGDLAGGVCNAGYTNYGPAQNFSAYGRVFATSVLLQWRNCGGDTGFTHSYLTRYQVCYDPAQLTSPTLTGYYQGNGAGENSELMLNNVQAAFNKSADSGFPNQTFNDYVNYYTNDVWVIDSSDTATGSSTTINIVTSSYVVVTNTVTVSVVSGSTETETSLKGKLTANMTVFVSSVTGVFSGILPSTGTWFTNFLEASTSTCDDITISSVSFITCGLKTVLFPLWDWVQILLAPIRYVLLLISALAAVYIIYEA